MYRLSSDCARQTIILCFDEAWLAFQRNCFPQLCFERDLAVIIGRYETSKQILF